MIVAVICFFRAESFTSFSRNHTNQLLDVRARYDLACTKLANWAQRLSVSVRQKIAPALTQNLLATLLFCPAVVYANPPTIRYAHPNQLVFSTLKKENGERNNPLLRLAKTLIQQAGFDFESVSYPAARMFHSMDQGYANFSILVYSPSLDKCCLMSKLPITTTQLRIYHKQETPRITNIELLAGKRIITIRGYSYGQLKPVISNPNNNIALSPAITHTSAFAMLEKGRADYVLDYKQPSIEVLQLHPIPSIQFEILQEIDVHLVIHKSFPNAPLVLAELERIIETMDIAGLLDLPLDPVF